MLYNRQSDTDGSYITTYWNLHILLRGDRPSEGKEGEYDEAQFSCKERNDRSRLSTQLRGRAVGLWCEGPVSNLIQHSILHCLLE